MTKFLVVILLTYKVTEITTIMQILEEHLICKLKASNNMLPTKLWILKKNQIQWNQSQTNVDKETKQNSSRWE